MQKILLIFALSCLLLWGCSSMPDKISSTGISNPDAKSNIKISDCEELIKWVTKDNPSMEVSRKAFSQFLEQEVIWIGTVLKKDDSRVIIKIRSIYVGVKSSQAFKENEIVEVRGVITGVDYFGRTFFLSPATISIVEP